ncbi:hypothetical protein ETH_00035785 [Eimeria tenella]|uniref:Uncharacterized protein n=1 Tax=Eimeria tenella TaxID=5802 RepID=U6KTB5_EIMTE|nr:hypothetical protein ETH_00035785 [Eimeria tenella]CDJ41357.1 hypothetical protein ETH_00035785 [Eimeria tenella]|eukprot:XP_013232107.1 hypothetical protein ETH_00035785 [Eimeria tenella]
MLGSPLHVDGFASSSSSSNSSSSSSSRPANVLVGVSTAKLLLVRFGVSFAAEIPAAGAAAAARPAAAAEEAPAAAAAAPEAPATAAAAAAAIAAAAEGSPSIVSSLNLPAVPFCCDLIRLPEVPIEAAAATAAAAGSSSSGLAVLGLTDGSAAFVLLQQSGSEFLLLPVGSVSSHQRAITAVKTYLQQQQQHQQQQQLQQQQQQQRLKLLGSSSSQVAMTTQ